MAWHGMAWYGMVWYGMVWYGMVWYGMVWYGMVWYGMVWYGMVWYGMVWWLNTGAQGLQWVCGSMYEVCTSTVGVGLESLGGAVTHVWREYRGDDGGGKQPRLGSRSVGVHGDRQRCGGRPGADTRAPGWQRGPPLPASPAR